eukprot:TRINITY_DN21859_c0_g1_i1.p1 TRINITY_DN21859_c0_g1~~TRINITY_DN21859_c0_g1_i1.p1  ORF type:complete len:355 (+),score=36.31 TRINITY_DN21859_c0_g1_i1:200-1264(+)
MTGLGILISCLIWVLVRNANAIIISDDSCLKDVSLGSWWGGCTQRSDEIINRLQHVMNRDIIAQEEAKKIILLEIEEYLRHLEQNSGKIAPTFHMVGPHGVGKSSLAQAIGRAFSRRMENGVPSALLSIQPEGYTLQEVEYHIYKNLKKCEKLIIFMDDIHKYENIDIVLRIVKRYSISIPGEPALSLNNTIILMTSDFESEGNGYDDYHIRVAEEMYSNNLILVHKTILVPFVRFNVEMYIELTIRYLRQSIACLFHVDVQYEYEHLSDYVIHHLFSEEYKYGGNAKAFVKHLDAVIDHPIRNQVISEGRSSKIIVSITVYSEIAMKNGFPSMQLRMKYFTREKSVAEWMIEK